jgi:hypothetical protein
MRSRRAPLVAVGLVLLALAFLDPTDLASATSLALGPAVKFSATFTPDRLGSPTSISLTLTLDPPAPTVPPPVEAVEVSLPTDLGLATSGLGLASCEPSALLTEGPAACPANSKMGTGTALVEVPFGPETIPETVALSLYAAPSSDGYIHLAILAYGKEPVYAFTVLSGVVHAGNVVIDIPPIPSVPAAPYVSLVRLHATLGGALLYHERVDNHTIAYRPRGIGLPDSCPHGGFPLAATFLFDSGERMKAATVVPCPARHALR